MNLECENGGFDKVLDEGVNIGWGSLGYDSETVSQSHSVSR